MTTTATTAYPYPHLVQVASGRRYYQLVAVNGASRRVVAYYDTETFKYHMTTASGRRAENDLVSLPILVQRYGPMKG